MKTVLITGVLGGMGSATAKLLIDNGYQVIGIDAKEQSQIEGLPITYYQADLTKSEEINKVYERVSEKIDSIYAIVHFAGVYQMDSLVEMEEQEFVRIFDINVFSIYRINKIFLPLLKKGSRNFFRTHETFRSQYHGNQQRH